jgi:Fe-S-cluster containining protein
LPLTDDDLLRIVQRTGDSPRDVVRWVDRDGIEMDDEPESFVELGQGKRVMTLRHRAGKCRYLGDDNRCTIYAARPLGCRVFPFDPTFDKSGKLKRLKIVKATEECPYELDGQNDPDALRTLHDRYEAMHDTFKEKIAEWNKAQRRRKRSGKRAQSARAFFRFIGFSPEA